MHLDLERVLLTPCINRLLGLAHKGFGGFLLFVQLSALGRGSHDLAVLLDQAIYWAIDAGISSASSALVIRDRRCFSASAGLNGPQAVEQGPGQGRCLHGALGLYSGFFGLYALGALGLFLRQLGLRLLLGGLLLRLPGGDVVRVVATARIGALGILCACARFWRSASS
jgi:hypothetical protein